MGPGGTYRPLVLVGIFITNYFIIEAGGSWHQWLGYSAAALVLLRLIWGLFPRYARIRAAAINRAAISAHHSPQRAPYPYRIRP